MSTKDDLERCVASGQIIPMKARLKPNQQPCRLIYITPETADWIRKVLIHAKTDEFFAGAATPFEQFDTVTRRFCSGEDMVAPFPHLMNPNKEGIWRLKTADLRAVGWAPSRGILIVSEIDLKANCDHPRDNQLFLNAIHLRRKLNIRSGLYLHGGFNDCF